MLSKAKQDSKTATIEVGGGGVGAPLQLTSIDSTDLPHRTDGQERHGPSNTIIENSNPASSSSMVTFPRGRIPVFRSTAAKLELRSQCGGRRIRGKGKKRQKWKCKGVRVNGTETEGLIMLG